MFLVPWCFSHCTLYTEFLGLDLPADSEDPTVPGLWLQTAPRKGKSEQLYTHIYILKAWQIPPWQLLAFCRPKLYNGQRNFKKLVRRCVIEIWLKRHEWRLPVNHITFTTPRFKCNFHEGSNASLCCLPMWFDKKKKGKAKWRARNSQSCSKRCSNYSKLFMFKLVKSNSVSKSRHFSSFIHSINVNWGPINRQTLCWAPASRTDKGIPG